jgi:hypothetical protein
LIGAKSAFAVGVDCEKFGGGAFGKAKIRHVSDPRLGRGLE